MTKEYSSDQLIKMQLILRHMHKYYMTFLTKFNWINYMALCGCTFKTMQEDGYDPRGDKDADIYMALIGELSVHAPLAGGDVSGIFWWKGRSRKKRAKCIQLTIQTIDNEILYRNKQEQQDLELFRQQARSRAVDEVNDFYPWYLHGGAPAPRPDSGKDFD